MNWQIYLIIQESVWKAMENSYIQEIYQVIRRNNFLNIGNLGKHQSNKSSLLKSKEYISIIQMIRSVI